MTNTSSPSGDRYIACFASCSQCQRKVRGEEIRNRAVNYLEHTVSTVSNEQLKVNFIELRTHFEKALQNRSTVNTGQRKTKCLDKFIYTIKYHSFVVVIDQDTKLVHLLSLTTFSHG
jgi:hypothetical protein